MTFSNRGNRIIVIDSNGREREKYPIVYGAKVILKKNTVNTIAKYLK